jgi:t-SNARE complex subunit (syntaxin)
MIRHRTLKAVRSRETSQTAMVTGDKLNNVYRETSRQFKNRRQEYQKDKTNDLETSSNNNIIKDLYNGINDFKKDY